MGPVKSRLFAIQLSGNSSVVEHRLAKARVAGSNPVSRSMIGQFSSLPLGSLPDQDLPCVRDERATRRKRDGGVPSSSDGADGA
jgi:hypothetical protein